MSDTDRKQLAAALRRDAAQASERYTASVALVGALVTRADAAADAIEELLQAKNAAYGERNLLVALAARLALEAGHPAYIGHDYDHEGDEGWDGWRSVVYITLPTGQLSWHIHDDEAPTFEAFLSRLAFDLGEFDGHTTEEKYRRLRDFLTHMYNGPDELRDDGGAMLASQRNVLGLALGKMLQRVGALHEDVAGATGPELLLAAETWMESTNNDQGA